MAEIPEIQHTLFGTPETIPETAPEGFRYAPEIISREEELELIARFMQIPLTPYVHEGYEAKRRVAFFGKHHVSDDMQILGETEPIPEYLHELARKAGSFAGINPAHFAHALVTEYQPGTPIGWHRDMPPFDKIVGISFAAHCTFRMRRELTKKDLKNGKDTTTRTSWERFTKTVVPRSAYIMEGPARYVWQHSIPPLEELRYSVTFRTIR